MSNKEDKEILYESFIDYLCDRRYEDQDIERLVTAGNKDPNSLVFDVEEVADIVYELDGDTAEILNYNLGLVLQKFDDSDRTVFVKLVHSIQLSLVQRRYIHKQVEQAENKLSEIQNRLSEIQKSSDEVDKKVKDIEDVKSAIYTDFIAILGIFTAITFATFGATSVLGSVFTNISNPTPIKLGYSLTIAGIYFLGLYGLISIMFTGIYRIMHKDRYVFTKPVTFSALCFGLLLLIVGGLIVLKLK